MPSKHYDTVKQDGHATDARGQTEGSANAYVRTYSESEETARRPSPPLVGYVIRCPPSANGLDHHYSLRHSPATPADAGYKCSQCSPRPCKDPRSRLGRPRPRSKENSHWTNLLRLLQFGSSSRAVLCLRCGSHQPA